MSARQLDLAREFCEKVGANDLLDYLGLDASVSPDEAQAALKARRRKMQGQQSNPKYRDEARNLIRQFQTLDAVLADPTEHVKDMAQRRESVHLPILEMTIKGVLAGGTLTVEQEDYLRSNAKELGVSEATFDDLLRRLQKDGTLSPAQARVGTPAPLQPVVSRLDPAGDGDVSPEAAVDSGERPTGRTAERAVPGPKTRSKRRKQNNDDDKPVYKHTPIVPPPRPSGTEVPRGPRDIDPLGGAITSAATAPPVRSRSAGPRGATTDPSTVQRRVDPAKHGRKKADPAIVSGMEVVGLAQRDIEVVGRRPAQLTIRVRLLGELPVAARVVPDDPWVSVVPQRLSPTQREHLVRVTVHPERMFDDTDETTIRLFNDLGEQVEVNITARRKTNWSSLGMIAAISTGVVALVAAIVLATQMLISNNAANSLTINIDPSSEFVLFDGAKIGSGPLVRLADPEMGPHTVTIVQENFETYEKIIELRRDEDRVLNVELELVDKLDFDPHPDDVPSSVPDDPGMWEDLETRMQGCLGRTPDGTAPYSGQVMITLRQSGLAGNVQLLGSDPVPLEVARCLTRQGATVKYKALAEGSYAKLLVDFAYPPAGSL